MQCTYFVGCKLQMIILPPFFIVSNGRPAAGIIWRLVPRHRETSACLIKRVLSTKRNLDYKTQTVTESYYAKHKNDFFGITLSGILLLSDDSLAVHPPSLRDCLEAGLYTGKIMFTY